MPTNLPSPDIQDSGRLTTLYYNSYGIVPEEFSANDVSATVSFFESKGFDKDAATSVTAVILNQAKSDGIPVFGLLDTLKGFDSVQLSALVAEILNNNRPPTSTLGYRDSSAVQNTQIRNIAP